MDFKNRLKLLRESMDLNKRELADKLGFSPSIISMYEAGERKPSIENLEILADFFNVDINYLLGKTDYTTRIVNAFNVQNLFTLDDTILKKKIPLLGTIAAGEPILAEQNIDDYVDIESAVQADFCLRVKGSSMINAGIQDGDIVFIRKQPDVEDGEIAAVLIDDEATLKRVFKFKGEVQLRAENPKFKPITLNGDKNILILGKATYKLSKLI